VLVPLPAQGHTNLMLKFDGRLAYHGLRPPLVLTHFVLSTGLPPGVPFEYCRKAVFDAGGMGSCFDPVEYDPHMPRAGRAPLPMADGSALRRQGVLGMDLGSKDLSPFFFLDDGRLPSDRTGDAGDKGAVKREDVRPSRIAVRARRAKQATCKLFARPVYVMQVVHKRHQSVFSRRSQMG
jgi:hypothetical protein